MNMLTDEEIKKAWCKAQDRKEPPGWFTVLETDRAISKASYEQALKDVGVALEEKSQNPPGTDYGRWDIIVELPNIIANLKERRMP